MRIRDKNSAGCSYDTIIKVYAKKITLILVAVLVQTFTLTAQNYTQHNWYFTGNDQALIFGKSPEAPPTLSPGKVAQNNIGEKLTVTDPTTGDLLFYSDGINIYDGTNQIIINGSGLISDPGGIQAISSSPIPGPGNESFYYVFHRNVAGDILYTIVDISEQGNRTEGPVSGQVIATSKNIPTGISGRGDGMITIGSRDLENFWLLTQDATSGIIEIYSIPPPGNPFVAETNLNLSTSSINQATPIEVGHFAYHNGTGLIAMVPKNDTNLTVIQFVEGGGGSVTLNPYREILNSYQTGETFGGSAGWSITGNFLYFSRNGTEGGLYRFDITDERPSATVETVDTYSVQESHSLMLAPDSAIYHLTRDTQGGGGIFQINRINQPDSAVNLIEYEQALFEGISTGSRYFSQFAPLKNTQITVTIGVQPGSLCQNTPIQFYPIIDPPTVTPDDITWDFQPIGAQLQQFAPIVTFDEAGAINASISVEVNGMTFTDMLSATIDENSAQLSLPDTTICPGETLTLDGEPQSGGGSGGGGGGSTGSYNYLWSTGEETQTIDVTESGDYWVVATPSSGGCPVFGTARVTVYGDENQTANIWYFGAGAGIDFNEEDGLDPPPRSITEAHAMDAPAGTSTISDANGDVLFYSNGTTVWTRENEIMANGTGLGGDSTNVQSVIIIPFPDDETLYYVFTTKAVYGENTYELKYSIVDMKGDEGNGEVTLKEIVLFANNTERIAAIEGGDGYWLLAHEYGNNTFRSYGITVDGISNPILSSAGAVHSYNDSLSAQTGMKFSDGGDRVAVSIIEGTDDYAELFNFDINTGEVTEFQYRIDLNDGGEGNDQVYDVHFSPGGNKLFATMNNREGGSPGGRILEYRIDSFSTEASRLASRADISNGSNLNVNFGQIQTGPNGAVYVAVETPGDPGGSNFVSSINVNEDTTGTSTITAQSIILEVGNSRLGLPNFVQNNANPPQEPSMSAPEETCVDERVPLSGTGTSDIDIFNWSITSQDDNSTVFSAAGQDTAYVFTETQIGLYNISLNISNRCGFDTTLVQQIEVLGIPDPPVVPQAVSICEGQPRDIDALGDPSADASGLTFEWTNSQGAVVSTARNYVIEDEEIYTIVISNALGCSSSADIFAGPPFDIELPEASTICQDEDLTLDSNVNANNYIWTVTNPDNSTTTLPNQRRATVDSSVPGEYLYVVSIEDPISNGCFVNDSTRVMINATPNLTLVSASDATCPSVTPDGEFTFNIGASGSFNYTVQDASGNVISQSSANGPTDINVPNLDGGIYSVSASSTSSGCTDDLTGIEIQNNNFSIVTPVPVTNAGCGTDDGSMTITLDDAGAFPVDYVLTRSEPGFVSRSVTGVAANGFTINNLPGGTYSIQVTSTANGCTATESNIVIDQPQDVQDLQISGTTEVCDVNPTTTLTATSDDGTSYVWTTPSGSTVNGATITATESGQYMVTADDPGNACPVSESIDVTLTIQPNVSINIDGDICTGQVTLQAVVNNNQPNANYNYTWTNSAGDNVGSGSQITVSISETYSVLVRESSDLTCTGSSSETVTFPEELEATISSTPACDDGSPVTLTVNVTSGNANSFTWSRDGEFLAQTGSTINVDDEGAYTVAISDGTCFIERSITVRRQAIPEGLLPEVEYYCSTRSTNPTLLAGRGFETYEWTLDGQPYPQADRTLEVMAPGEYVVTMTTAIGCVRTDTVTIVESCDPEVIAPNAFSPSSAPPNNTFSVFPNDFVDNFEVFIYTRWGELIYQSETTEFKWDGTFNGELVPLGTYPYVIRFTSRFEPERGVFEQRGSVTVIR